MSGQKIIDGLNDAIAGNYGRISHRLVTDIRTARRLGLPYVWEMASRNRPTGRVIVTIPDEHPLANEMS